MQSLSADFLTHLTKVLKKLNPESGEIESIASVSGGSINDAFHLKLNCGSYFLKVNQAKKFPGMIEYEIEGLNMLYMKSRLKIPKPYLQSVFEGKSYLILEFIKSGDPNNGFWMDFGRGLAELHQNTNPFFGLKNNNYIGSLIQKNNLKKNWNEFFIENRLQAQEKLAMDQGVIDAKSRKLLAELYPKIERAFPPEPPALIHGDFWSGNFLIDEFGKAVIVDPAVYYGNREMDLAMSYLFGGFSAEFYQAYNHSYPLKAGWESRIELCNLYPLLVHLNLFGAAYEVRLKNSLRNLLRNNF